MTITASISLASSLSRQLFSAKTALKNCLYATCQICLMTGAPMTDLLGLCANNTVAPWSADVITYMLNACCNASRPKKLNVGLITFNSALCRLKQQNV